MNINSEETVAQAPVIYRTRIKSGSPGTRPGKTLPLPDQAFRTNCHMPVQDVLVNHHYERFPNQRVVPREVPALPSKP
jgi:hypothetical protein